jgi:hypothetical protein
LYLGGASFLWNRRATTTLSLLYFRQRSHQEHPDCIDTRELQPWGLLLQTLRVGVDSFQQFLFEAKGDQRRFAHLCSAL